VWLVNGEKGRARRLYGMGEARRGSPNTPGNQEVLDVDQETRPREEAQKGDPHVASGRVSYVKANG